MVCKPIIPQSFITPESQTFDFSARSLLNPISNYNSTQLRAVNLLNNVLLKRYDLTQYPNLKARAELGAISDVEFADFLLDSGMDLSFVQETFINDFPVEVDYDLIRDIVVQVVGDDTSGNIIGTENPSNLERFMRLQDNYYQGSLLLDNANVCSVLNNAFSGVISILSTARDLAAGLKDIFTDIEKAITDLQSYDSVKDVVKDLTGKAFGFQGQLEDFVDEFAEQMLDKLDSVKDSVKRLYDEGINVPIATFNHLTKKIQNVERIFSDDNKKDLKENLKKIFTDNLNQFEDVLPDVVNMLLINICGLFDKVKSYMKEPVDNVSNMVVSYKNEREVMSGYSKEIRNEVKQTGAPRPSPAERKKQRDDGLGVWARANPSNKIPGDLNSDERDLLDKLTEDGIPGYFTFVGGRNIRNMGKKSTETFNPNDASHKKYYDKGENFHYEGGPAEGGTVDAGWKKVNPTVWIKLIRAIDGMRAAGYSETLTITSAYRSTFYNRIIVGGAKSSYHMAGEALDISYGNLSTGAGEELIRQCSIQGFGGISHYSGSNFTHFDIGPVRTWSGNGKYTSIIDRHRYG